MATEIQSKATQARKVLDHMREKGGITGLEAMQQYGIMRLASRVHDLRRAGHDVKVETISVPTRDKGMHARVAMYSLVGQQVSA